MKMKKQIEYPFSKNQTFYIGLIISTSDDKDYEYVYVRNIKPISKRIANWVNKDELELVFEIPRIGEICIVTRFIDNKSDMTSVASYFVSTKDDEKYIKETIINYKLHHIKESLSILEEEKKDLLNKYSKLSKYLLI